MPFPFSLTTPLSREYLAAVQKAGGDNKPNYSSMEGSVSYTHLTLPTILLV